MSQSPPYDTLIKNVRVVRPDAQEVDTLIVRAEELLGKFPKGKVAYDPEKYGWQSH